MFLSLLLLSIISRHPMDKDGDKDKDIKENNQKGKGKGDQKSMGNVISHDDTETLSIHDFQKYLFPLTHPHPHPDPQPTPSPPHSHCVILLNSPPSCPSLSFTNISLFCPLYQSSPLRIVCDGAANHLISNEEKLFKTHTPHVVIGDFDSITTESLQKIKQNPQIKLIKISDQNSTDLDKALKYVVNSSFPFEISTVLVFGAFDGRFDSVISNFHSALKFINFPIRILLIGKSNMAEWMGRGKHKIIVGGVGHQRHCGIFPLGSPAHHVSTRGLEWEMSDMSLEWGSILSTNNVIKDNEKDIHIQTDGNMVFTMEY